MTKLDSLPVQKFSGSNCHWSMSRVNQVVDVLTVLIGEGIFAASAEDHHIRCIDFKVHKNQEEAKVLRWDHFHALKCYSIAEPL